MFKATIISKLIYCVGLVVLADFLFYRQPVGWTAGLYAALLLAVLVGFNHHLFDSRASKILLFGIINLIVTLIEAWQSLAVVLISLGMMSLLILQKRQHLPDARLWLADIRRFMWQGTRQSYRDFHSLQQIGKNKPRESLNLRYALLPIALTLLFVILFAQANPIIAQVLNGVDWELLLRLLSVWRWLFWTFTAGLIWAFLRPRFPLAQSLKTSTAMNLERWLNQQTLTFSLLLFNGVFALQNGLDILFLWSGKALPEGVTYAEYVHSGAYPLFFTSFLTAGYVLITFGEHQQKFHTVLTKKLTFLWLAQNIFLEVSAINRLLQYIEVYSLTYLRINALICMALTALGLLLISMKIYTHRHNNWLINANALALVLTVYASCFVNMDKMIADYNVHHAVETTGNGINADLNYLRSLGTEALPALRWFQAHANENYQNDSEYFIEELEQQLVENSANWRAWSWRNQRQQKAIKATPVQAVPIGDGAWHYPVRSGS